MSKIIVDRQELNAIKAKLKKMKDSLSKTELKLNEIKSLPDKDDAAIFQINEYEILRDDLRNKIKFYSRKITECTVVENNESSLIAGDIVKVTTHYDETEYEEGIYELVATEEEKDFKSSICKIYMFSPLGKAILEAARNGVGYYKVNNQQFKVSNLEKVEVKALKKINEDS